MREKKEDCEAHTLTALAVGVGFGVIIGAAILAAIYPVFQSEKWAAWIQAIGSVFAIFIAVHMAKKQAETSRSLQRKQFLMLAKERQRNDVNSLRAIEFTVQLSLDGTSNACDSLSKMDMNNCGKVQDFVAKVRLGVEVAKLAVDRLLVQEHPGAMLAPQILNIKHGFVRVLALFDRIERAELQGVKLEAQDIVNLFKRHREAISEIMERYDGTQVLVRNSDRRDSQKSS